MELEKAKVIAETVVRALLAIARSQYIRSSGCLISDRRKGGETIWLR